MDPDIAGDDDFRKVGFDARKGYYENLQKVLWTVNQAELVGDIELFMRSSWSLFKMVRSYIKRSKAVSIEESLTKIENTLEQSRALHPGFRAAQQRKLWRELRTENYRIHEEAKAMFLPLSGEQSAEVDWDAIERES